MIYDLVIMLSGNSYTLNVPEESLEITQKTIADAVLKGGGFVCLRDGQRLANIKVDAILGWYSRKHVTPVNEKMLAMVAEQTQILKKLPGDGDDWKNSDSE